MYIRETIRIIDALDWTKAEREQVYYKNRSGLRGRRL